MTNSAIDFRISSPPRVSELVVNRLLALMQSGHFVAGSRLPPERELADLLDVSRSAVREALAGLQLTGLVERRQGVGTTLKRVPADLGSFELGKYIEAGSSIAELIDTRMALDLGITHILCDRKRKFDFRSVATMLDAMKLHLKTETGLEDYIQASFDFHSALAHATGQRHLIKIQEELAGLMGAHLWLLVERYDIDLARESLKLHEHIFSAIRDQDLITALAHVKHHYTDYPLLHRQEFLQDEKS